MVAACAPANRAELGLLLLGVVIWIVIIVIGWLDVIGPIVEIIRPRIWFGARRSRGDEIRIDPDFGLGRQDLPTQRPQRRKIRSHVPYSHPLLSRE